MKREDITLESLLDVDQEAIRKFRKREITSDELRAVADQNQEYVSEYIQQNGFPFKNVASEKAYKAAVIIVLHSNVALMNKVIELFSSANEKQIDKKDLAFLVDKSKVLQGSPQIYGTQYKIGEDKSIVFLPIENEAEVDKRRLEMGMETLQEYRNKATGSHI